MEIVDTEKQTVVRDKNTHQQQVPVDPEAGDRCQADIWAHTALADPSQDRIERVRPGIDHRQ